MTLRMVCR